MSDEQQVAGAFQSALDDALAPQRSYDYDELPDPRPKSYVQHTVDRAFGGSVRMSGGHATVAWRLTTRVVAKHVRDARVLRRRVGTLEDLPLPGVTDATPLRFESQEPIGADDDWYSGLTTWTFEAPTLTPTPSTTTPTP